MPKTEENLSFQDKLKAWWETDTAKAVATIVAVLLIPASVIAWNYATTQGNDIRNQMDTSETSEETLTEESEGVESENGDPENSENAMEEEVIEAEQEEIAANEPVAEQVTNQEQANTNETAEEPVPGQEPANTNENVDESQPAVGGLGSVEKLPNTTSSVQYTTVKGDNVYRVSMKVCGNDSFYRLNLGRDYLKVGQTLAVTCN